MKSNSLQVQLSRLAMAGFVTASFGMAAQADQTVTQIAGGHVHACALTSAGGVKCTGENSDGQLGDGTTNTRLSMADVPGLTSGVTAVATGIDFSCALTDAGGVKCWGANDSGQVGNGATTITDVLSPEDVVGLTSGVVAISAGDGHACALTISGAVKCWGRNFFGELGNNTSTFASSPHPPMPNPVDVVGLSSGVVAISAGTFHTCAVLSSGQAKCWGYNGNGQLGTGTGPNQLTPADVSGLSNAVDIKAADNHTCALTNAGGVACWGDNTFGQLGDGTNNPALTPIGVSGLSSGIRALSIGGRHTCALTTGDGAVCWGRNALGTLGDGSNTDSNVPVNMTGLTSGVLSVSAGSVATCVVKSGGVLQCTGANYRGGLGDGTTNDHNTAMNVLGLSTFAKTLQSISLTTPSSPGVGNSVGLVAGASSALPVVFDTWTPGSCSLAGNTLTILSTGFCGIRASQPGDATFEAAPQALVLIATLGGSDAPTIGHATAGNGTVSVVFTAPLNDGGSPITGYDATCSGSGGPFTASGPTSPLAVTVPNGTAVTCTVTATNGLGTSAASASSNSVTPSAVGISIDDVSITEGNAGTKLITFTVTRTGGTGAVTFDWSTADGTANAGSDYATVPATPETIPANGTGQVTVQVTLNGDTGNELDETLFVNLTNVVGAVAYDDQGVGTILNDDLPPKISINNPSVSEGSNATFTLSLDTTSSQTVTVWATTANGTACDCSDFTAPPQTLITFLPGEVSKTFMVATLTDALDEVDETFDVLLYGETNATLQTASGTATILDTNAPPDLSIDSPSITEGDAGTSPLTFTASLSGPSGKTVTIQIATSAGTALGTEDFVDPGGATLSFAPGETTKTYIVPVVGDLRNEATETFSATLSGGNGNANLVTAVGTGTILDNDPTPSISINDVTLTEANSGTQMATFTLTLSAASGQTVTVSVSTADGTATAPADYAANGPVLVTFNPGQTSKSFVVVVQNDTIPEGDDTFFAVLSGATNATITPGGGVGTIRNDDIGVTTGLVISEFRLQGLAGAEDEFIEVANKTATAILVATAYPSTGFAVAKSGGTILFTIPNGTVIRPLGHYLGVNSNGYSLGAYSSPNATWTGDVSPANTGIAIFKRSDLINATTVMDAVGFGSVTAPYFEGTALPNSYTTDGQYAHVRKMTSGAPADGGKNSTDFQFVATTPGPFGTAQQPIQGSPGPENLANPVIKNGTILAGRLDPGRGEGAVPNREYTAGFTYGTQAYAGVLSIRRTMTNNTGAPLTQLRFRVTDITTLNSPIVVALPQADIRWVDSTSELGVVTSTVPKDVEGVTIDAIPTVGDDGAGLNASGQTGVITLATPLGVGASVNIHFQVAVSGTGGNFRFLINLEGLNP